MNSALEWTSCGVKIVASAQRSTKWVVLFSILILCLNFILYTGPRVFAWSYCRKLVYVVATKDISGQKWQDWSTVTIKGGTTLQIIFQNDNAYYAKPMSKAPDDQILVVPSDSLKFITTFIVDKDSFLSSAPEPGCSSKTKGIKAGSQVVVEGVSGDWLLCRTNTGDSGWLRANVLRVASATISQDTWLSQTPNLAKSDVRVQKGSQVTMLGTYGSAGLVKIQKDGESLLGWVPRQLAEVRNSE